MAFIMFTKPFFASGSVFPGKALGARVICKCLLRNCMQRRERVRTPSL
jgi:hypothetical protein